MTYGKGFIHIYRYSCLLQILMFLGYFLVYFFSILLYIFFIFPGQQRSIKKKLRNRASKEPNYPY